MDEGDWVTEEGNTGEVPVKIHPDGEVEFLLGFAEGYASDRWTYPSTRTLRLPMFAS